MAKKKPKAAQAHEAPEALVYIGPPLSGTLLMRPWTVYKGGALPEAVAARCAVDGAFAALFVPVSGLSAARAALGIAGHPINRAAQAVARNRRG